MASASSLEVDQSAAATGPAMAESNRCGLRKGLYLLPSAFTAANIGMGFFAVMRALRGFQLCGTGQEAEF